MVGKFLSPVRFLQRMVSSKHLHISTLSWIQKNYWISNLKMLIILLPADIFPLVTDASSCPPTLLRLVCKEIFDWLTDAFNTARFWKESLNFCSVSGGAVAVRAIIGTFGRSMVMHWRFLKLGLHLKCFHSNERWALSIATRLIFPLSARSFNMYV